MHVKAPNMTPELLKQFEGVLTRPADAHDDESALFSHVEKIDQGVMLSLARQSGGVVEAIVRSEGEVVTMRDGKQYKVGPNGQWIRMDPDTGR